jgi:PAS domain S-box-containing protein
MRALTSDLNQVEPVKARTAVLLREQLEADHKRTDRMFAWLMVVQWLAGVAAALWLSPRAWEGEYSHTHIHVWVALFLGGTISGFPIFLALTRPGSVLTRHVIAVGQMLTCGLLIHLSGGRIEMHFQYFGALAFLAFYRDERVLLTATVVAGTDHFIRGMYWPQSIFGVLAASWWRWLEHEGWIVFEDIFLVLAIRQTLREMLGVAERQAKLETVNETIERTVAERTSELRREIGERARAEESLRLLGSAVEQSKEAILITDAELQLPGPRILFVNPAFTKMTGYTAEEAIGQTPRILQGPRTDKTVLNRLRHNLKRGEAFEGEGINYRKDRTEFNLEWHIAPIRDASAKITHFVAIERDITERKRAQAELESVHKQLVEASRRGGMAEIATNVLHNVGNVLNSINISTDIIAESVKKFKEASLARVVVLLQEHAHDLGDFITHDPKGKHVPAYLAQISEHLMANQQAITGELGSLRQNVEHIKEIVAMQQNYATVGGVKEIINVVDLVEDSMRINEGGLLRHGVEIIREFEAVPPMNVEKHKILQILVNLLRNAKYACDESGRADKRITLRVANSEGGVKMSVMDNGIGIPRENLTRIFNYGFTTRKDGHGFGLHSGALAAKAMGGSLTGYSDGPGLGAVFTLELPCPTQENSHE